MFAHDTEEQQVPEWVPPYETMEEFHEFLTCGPPKTCEEYNSSPYEARDLLNRVCHKYAIVLEEFRIPVYHALVGYQVCEATYVKAIEWCGLCFNGEAQVPDTGGLYEKYYTYLLHLLEESVENRYKRGHEHVPGRKHYGHRHGSGRGKQRGHKRGSGGFDDAEMQRALEESMLGEAAEAPPEYGDNQLHSNDEVVQAPPYNEEEAPNGTVCPISCAVMEDPVVCMDGHTYERVNIEKWLETKDTSPKTGNRLESKTLVPNIDLKKVILEWKEKNSQP